MNIRRLGEPLAALDLDLVAIEFGVEGGRQGKVVAGRRYDKGFQRRVDLLAEAEGVEKAAAVEQWRRIQALRAASLQIMRQRVDVGVGPKMAFAIKGNVEQRMRIDAGLGALAHEIEQRIAPDVAAQAIVVIGREQRRRTRAVAPA